MGICLESIIRAKTNKNLNVGVVVNRSAEESTDKKSTYSQQCGCCSARLCKQLRVSIHRLTPTETAELCTVTKKPKRKAKRNKISKTK